MIKVMTTSFPGIQEHLFQLQFVPYSTLDFIFYSPQTYLGSNICIYLIFKSHCIISYHFTEIFILSSCIVNLKLETLKIFGRSSHANSG